MDVVALPPTGTCELSTLGRRSGRVRRIEIWYVVVDGRIVLTGTPGARHWLANLRENPGAVLHLREPVTDLDVVAEEVTDRATRRRIIRQAWRIQPWYATQAYSVEDWVSGSPMVLLTRPGSSTSPCASGGDRGWCADEDGPVPHPHVGGHRPGGATGGPARFSGSAGSPALRRRCRPR